MVTCFLLPNACFSDARKAMLSTPALFVVLYLFVLAFGLWMLHLPAVWQQQLIQSVENDSEPTLTYERCVARGFTPIVSVYDRLEVLNITLHHWVLCPHVSELHVVWHNPDLEVPPHFAHLGALGTPVHVRHHPDNKLTNRFKQPGADTPASFASGALFSVDDDVVIDCQLLTAAFKLWCTQEVAGRPALVGFEPRLFDVVSDEPAQPQGYSWAAACKGDCAYNTLWATKGAFLHAHFYEAFWQPRYAHIRAAVDSWVTGEDMLMSAVLMEQQVQPMVVHPARDCALDPPAVPKHVLAQYSSLVERTSSKRPQVRQLIHEHFHHRRLLDAATTLWYMLDDSGAVSEVDQPCQEFPLVCSH
jgi:hypothetical protein